MKRKPPRASGDRLYWLTIWAMIIFLLVKWLGFWHKAAPYVPHDLR